MAADAKLLNALTIDVEDYYHVTAFENHVERSRWGDYESRVVANTHRLMKLLDRHDVRGTFFVLGWVAQQFPQLVRDIHSAGHEIGSHTFWHRLIYQLSPEEFRSDLRQSRDILEDLIGIPVTAFRAPSFSITSKSLWAIDVLIEEGFQVDSSIFPIGRARYGIPHAPKHLFQLRTKAGAICEFPPSVVNVARRNIPVCGGGYFRLYPGFVTQHGLAKFNHEHELPFVFYLHPWEIDPEQPRLNVGSRMNRFRHYVNLGRTERKLDSLLKRFRFGTLSQSIAESAFESDESTLSSCELSAA